MLLAIDSTTQSAKKTAGDDGQRSVKRNKRPQLRTLGRA
jgi:hypothetical protein